MCEDRGSSEYSGHKLRLISAAAMGREMRLKTNSGFSLIEVLVATSIFSVALLGLAMGATSVIRQNQTSLHTTIATNLAQDKLEELKAKTTANIDTSGSPEDGLTVSGVPVKFNRSWTVVLGGSTINGNINCPNVVEFKCVTVTVSWTDYTNRQVTVSSAVKI